MYFAASARASFRIRFVAFADFFGSHSGGGFLTILPLTERGGTRPQSRCGGRRGDAERRHGPRELV